MKFRKAVDTMVRYDTVVLFAPYCKWMCQKNVNFKNLMTSLTALVTSFSLRTAHAVILRRNTVRPLHVLMQLFLIARAIISVLSPVLLVSKCSLTYLYLKILGYPKLCMWELIMFFGYKLLWKFSLGLPYKFKEPGISTVS